MDITTFVGLFQVLELQQKLIELDELEHNQSQQQQLLVSLQQNNKSSLTTSNSNPKFPRSNPFNKTDEDPAKHAARSVPVNAIWPQIHANYGRKIESDRLAWCQKHSKVKTQDKVARRN